MRTPAVIAAKAGQKRKPSRKATAQPVQAPVMGNGMATKIANAVKFKGFMILDVFITSASEEPGEERISQGKAPQIIGDWTQKE